MERWWLRIAALLCITGLLCACTLSDSLRHDNFVSVWSQPDAHPTIFFVTDREAVFPGFNQHWGASLHCGEQDTPVPSGDKVEDFKAPSVPCETAADLAAFVARVVKRSRDSHCNSVLLFVHGYNTTFRSALLRSGQAAGDIQWPCAALLFSWSSEGQFNRYVADAERSGYAVPALLRLLADLNKEGVTINILAHSMGNRITLSALGGLCSENAVSVNQLILAAPDVSAESGNDDFGHLLERDQKCVSRTTIYASDNDMALMVSESIHGGIPRAGRVPLQDIQYLHGKYGNIDLVDASFAPGDPVGHGYFALSYEMADDIMWTLAGRALETRAAAAGPGEQTLYCRDSKAADCAGGRYALIVAKDRRPDQISRLTRHILALIYTIQ